VYFSKHIVQGRFCCPVWKEADVHLSTKSNGASNSRHPNELGVFAGGLHEGCASLKKQESADDVDLRGGKRVRTIEESNQAVRLSDIEMLVHFLYRRAIGRSKVLADT
jgi:hypothetical protein